MYILFRHYSARVVIIQNLELWKLQGVACLCVRNSHLYIFCAHAQIIINAKLKSCITKVVSFLGGRCRFFWGFWPHLHNHWRDVKRKNRTKKEKKERGEQQRALGFKELQLAPGPRAYRDTRTTHFMANILINQQQVVE